MQSCTLLFRQVQNNRLKNSAFQGRSIYKFRDEKRLFVQTNVFNPSSSSFEMYQLSGSEQIYTPKTASARPHGKELKVRVTSAIVCQCVSFSWYVTIPQLNAGTNLAFFSTGKMRNKSLLENRRENWGRGVGMKEAGIRESKPTAFLTLHSWPPLPTPSFTHKSNSFTLIFELRRI